MLLKMALRSSEINNKQCDACNYFIQTTRVFCQNNNIHICDSCSIYMIGIELEKDNFFIEYFLKEEDELDS